MGQDNPKGTDKLNECQGRDSEGKEYNTRENKANSICDCSLGSRFLTESSTQQPFWAASRCRSSALYPGRPWSIPPCRSSSLNAKFTISSKLSALSRVCWFRLTLTALPGTPLSSACVGSGAGTEREEARPCAGGGPRRGQTAPSQRARGRAADMGAPARGWVLRAARFIGSGGKASAAALRLPSCGPALCAAPFGDSAVSAASSPLWGGNEAGGSGWSGCLCLRVGGAARRREGRGESVCSGVTGACVLAAASGRCRALGARDGLRQRSDRVGEGEWLPGFHLDLSQFSGGIEQSLTACGGTAAAW